MMTILTLNCEGDKHYDLWTEWIATHRPDVVCLQEAFSADAFRLAPSLGYNCVTAPLTQIVRSNKYGLQPKGPWGLALWVRSDFELLTWQAESYAYKSYLPEFTTPNSVNRVLLSARIKKRDQELTVATTHFTWTGDGKPSDEQRHDLEQMLKILKTKGELILCGDFNAPRGTEIFSQLASHFTDNIPVDVTSTLDAEYHYAGKLDLVVDGFFTTPAINCSNCQVLTGLSDHCGVVGEILV